MSRPASCDAGLAAATRKAEHLYLVGRARSRIGKAHIDGERCRASGQGDVRGAGDADMHLKYLSHTANGLGHLADDLAVGVHCGL